MAAGHYAKIVSLVRTSPGWNDWTAKSKFTQASTPGPT
jgi:hypothetical protein